MRHLRSVFLLAFCACPGGALFAQSSAPASEPATSSAQTTPQASDAARLQRLAWLAQQMVITQANGCPVAVSARRSPLGTVVVTGDSRYPTKPVPQAVLLRIGGQVAEIHAIAYGPAPGAHLMPTSAGQERAQSFTLIGASRDADGNFRIETRRMSTVQRIVLTEIRFTDGIIWTPTAEQHCDVAPSGYMLVGAQDR